MQQVLCELFMEGIKFMCSSCFLLYAAGVGAALHCWDGKKKGRILNFGVPNTSLRAFHSMSAATAPKLESNPRGIPRSPFVVRYPLLAKE